MRTRQSREARLEKRRAYYAKTKHLNRAYYVANAEALIKKSAVWYAAHRDLVLERAKRKRLENPQLDRDKCKRWREANREIWLAGKKRWWNKNREAIRAQKKLYYQANKESIKTKVAAYTKKNPEVIANTMAKRRAQKQGSQVDPLGIKKWMKEVKALPFARCHWCGTKVSGGKIQFDHVVALNIGGSHTMGNLCASCRDCNYSKHDRALSEWVCRGQRFLSL